MFGGRGRELESWEVIALGALAGALGCIATTPADVMCALSPSIYLSSLFRCLFFQFVCSTYLSHSADAADMMPC